MNLWRLFGYARTEFYTHPSSLPLYPKDSKTSPTANPNPESKEKATLLSLCKASTPPCRLNPLLFNGHLQTLWTAVKSYDIPIYYKRRIFTADEGVSPFPGTFAVDFVVEPYQDGKAVGKESEKGEYDEGEGGEEEKDDMPPRTTLFGDDELEKIGSLDEKPMVVTLHGLTGGSHEIYLRSVLQPLVEAGWEACVVLSRGCAGSKITTGMLYNARSTWDFRQVVKWLRKTFPNRPLFGLGFSLGANMLANYLGEEGENCILKAAVVCSNPWNLEVGSQMLQRSWIGLEVYSRFMGTSLKGLFECHVDVLSQNPRVDVESVRQTTYLHEFDRALQAPTFGYATETAYYRDASSSDSLLAVKVPLFALHAEDDPIAMKESLPKQEFRTNPYTVLCTTALGGHLSWFEPNGGRWFAKPASQFLIKMYDEVNLDRLHEAPVPQDASSVNASSDLQTAFNPMRRKLHIDLER